MGRRGDECTIREAGFSRKTLPGCFADAIPKAREKTLGKSFGDPDKLRGETEELERQRREEKARLPAEARRKRELEREAARQALLEMERTVEINEKCQILKDLEMLGTAITGTLPTCVDGTSPDHPFVGGIGGLKLGGSNPLEQLGLFMKADDEDDEDVVSAKNPVNEAEGETD